MLNVEYIMVRYFGSQLEIPSISSRSLGVFIDLSIRAEIVFKFCIITMVQQHHDLRPKHQCIFWPLFFFAGCSLMLKGLQHQLFLFSWAKLIQVHKRIHFQLVSNVFCNSILLCSLCFRRTNRLYTLCQIQLVLVVRQQRHPLLLDMVVWSQLRK